MSSDQTDSSWITAAAGSTPRGTTQKATNHKQCFVVLAKQKRQKVHGFGASDAWSTQFVGTWPLPKRQAIADLLFSTAVDGRGKPRGIGLSGWRFNIGAGSAEQGAESGIADEWRRAECFMQPDGAYDWKKQAGSVWFLTAARDYGVDHITAFVNSPPAHMTKSGRANADQSDVCNIETHRIPSFATFLTTVLRHLQDEMWIPISSIRCAWMSIAGVAGLSFWE